MKSRMFRLFTAALTLMFALCMSAFAFAETTETPLLLSSDTDIATETPDAATEAPEATEETETVNVILVVCDEEGEPISYADGYTYFINHQYTIKAVKEITDLPEADDVTLELTCDDEYRQYFTIEGGTITVNNVPKTVPFELRVVRNGQEIASGSYKTTTMKFSIMDTIIIAIGLYGVVTAITGKGAMFKNEFVKEEKRTQFKKLVRAFSVTFGIAMLVASAVSIFLSYIDIMKIVYYVLFGIGLAALIAILVVSNKMTDKDKKEKARISGATGAKTSAAAFEFDGTEPTIDDVLAERKKNERNK